MDGPFDSAWLKWGWAVVHAQALDQQIVREMRDYNSRESYSARTEYDAKSHCVILRLQDVRPLPAALGLRLGDVANNFRACLDHLAWTLVQGGKRRPTANEEERIYFPIAPSPAAFRKHLVVREFLRPAERAIVRRYQPYVHGKRRLPLHCLSPLARLNSDDKHRMIRPVLVVPQRGKLFYGEPTDCEITRIPAHARGVVLEPSAEIQRIYVRRTGPNPNVHMEAELAVNPTLDGRIPVTEWLTQATAHTHDLLREFAKPPQEIQTLGIIPAPHGVLAPN